MTLLERWQADAPAWLREAIANYYNSWPPFADRAPEELPWAEQVEDFMLFTMRHLEFEKRDGGLFHYEVTEVDGPAPVEDLVVPVPVDTCFRGGGPCSSGCRASSGGQPNCY